MWSRWFSAVTFVLCLGISLPASAWTSARVRDVRAEITVLGDGSAEVLLDLGVEVLGGWLERLDLEGLDEELVLDEREPAWLTTLDGVHVPAVADAEAGAITLRFDKRSAARRGLHRVHVRYLSPLVRRASAVDAAQLEIPWVLPGWEHGLMQAQIRVRGPRGLRLVRDPEQAVEVQERVQDGQSVIELTRLLVPRSTAWTVLFAAPATLFADPQGSASSTSAESVKSSSYSGALAALCVLTLGFVSRRSFRGRAESRGVRLEPVIAADRARRTLAALCTLVASASGTGTLFVLAAALLALSLCFMDRLRVLPLALPLGRFAPLSRAHRQDMRRQRLRELVGSTPFTDASTLVGGVGATLMLFASVWAARSDRALAVGLMCTLPFWFASSRLRLPRPIHEQVDLLVRAAKRSLALSCAMRLLAFSVGDRELCSARLRVVPSARFSGLLRLDVGVDTRRGQRALVLIAMTQTGSLADHTLSAQAGAFLRELSPQGHRAAHMQPIEELGAALEAVLSCLAQQSQRAVEHAEPRQAA